MAVGYECPECRTCWPHYRSFATCPECRVVCRSAVTPRVLTADQAKKRILNVEFLRYYNAREAYRVGPTPEEIGRREAREQLARIAELNDSLKDEGSG